MGLEERPGPECLDNLEDPWWEHVLGRTGVVLEVRGEGRSPALERRNDRVGARASHTLADRRNRGVFSLAQQRKRGGLNSGIERLIGGSDQLIRRCDHVRSVIQSPE